MQSHESRITSSYRTPCGVHVERTVEVLERSTTSGTASSEAAPGRSADALRALAETLDRRRGLLLCSTFEYPGRYRRSAVGFVDPPLVLESRGATFTLQALNARGQVLLQGVCPALSEQPDFQLEVCSETLLGGVVVPASEPSSEELRTKKASVLSVVRALSRALRHEHEPYLGLYGTFGYDLVFQFEQLRAHARRGSTRERELVLYLPDRLLVRDDASGSTTLRSYEFGVGARTTHGLARAGQDQPYAFDGAPASACDHGPGEFEQAVERAKSAFVRGDLFEVTLSQTFARPYRGAPSALFTALTESNPSPYGFMVNLGQGELLIGASPEMYVRVTGDMVETCPIAGTIARGADALADAAQIRALIDSDKDEAELTMCTDVDRNDKARVCEPGSVRVIGRRQIELYSRLIHTVDHVTGTLRAGFDAVDALLTHMWAVTLTGAPKLDAMQFIEDHERSSRGFYGGAVGSLRFDGSLDTGLVLRAAHLQRGTAYVRAGATLLYDSDPTSERRESELKASAVLGAIEQASRVAQALPVAPGSDRLARSGTPLRVLLIDHRDSFVHTLADYFRQAGCRVTTLRHGFAEREFDRLEPQLVVLSPGPMRPDDFSLRETLCVLERRSLPVFGVCLGLQAMVEYAGGTLMPLSPPVHGKASELCVLDEGGLFQGLPARFQVGRYHSLQASADAFPSQLRVLARTADGCVMALAHRQLPWSAVQFHPESILSASVGLQLLRNVVSMARSRRRPEPLYAE
jgi:anthranilate synthase